MFQLLKFEMNYIITIHFEVAFPFFQGMKMIKKNGQRTITTRS